MQPDAVGGGEPDIVIIQVDIPGGADELGIGKEDGAFFGDGQLLTCLMTEQKLSVQADSRQHF